MDEPRELVAAREHLSRAERDYRSTDGLYHLEEGLAILDELIGGEDARLKGVARNLARTYASRLFASVGSLLERDRGVPEPELEHLFKVMLAFDQGDFELPARARAAKIDLVRRLIDLYYEGHPAEEKREALERLTLITRRPA